MPDARFSGQDTNACPKTQLYSRNGRYSPDRTALRRDFIPFSAEYCYISPTSLCSSLDIIPPASLLNAKECAS
jgi:hypothetical protein